MALTRCPECRGKASTSATACPHCGHPLRPETASTAGAEETRAFARGSERATRPWYYSTGFIAIALVVLAPLGILLMWGGRRFPVSIRIVLSGFFGTAFIVGITRDTPTSAPVGTQRSAPQARAAAASPRREAKTAALRLPPEPEPSVAHKADEVPKLEEQLRTMPVYGTLWQSGHEADRDLVLTGLSELLAQGGFRDPLIETLEDHPEHERVVVLLSRIHARVGSYPRDFTDQLRAHVQGMRDEIRLGLWRPARKGEPPYDMTALAAWLHRDHADYIRERIAANRGGPYSWSGLRSDGTTPRPYLVDEQAALEWLSKLTTLTAKEQQRFEWLRRPGFGDRFEIGSFAYVIEHLEVTRRVGGRFARENASDGARFVLVHYKLENLGMKTETVMVDDLVLVDARGREFRSSSRANTALAMSQRKKSLMFDELQPGLSRDLVTAFEVPAEVADQPMTLVVSEKGLLGTGKVAVAVEAR